MVSAESITFGFVFALSSTALVLRTLSERNELDALMGDSSWELLFFGSLHRSMVLIIPILSQGLNDLAVRTGFAMGQALLMVVGLFVCSRKLVLCFQVGGCQQE